METIVISPKQAFKVPVEVEIVSPDYFAGRDLAETENLIAWEGNRRRRFRELFKITGDVAAVAGDQNLLLDGDFTRVRRIGRCMSEGSITVQGSVGMYLGEEMAGGCITVQGDAGSWVGFMMRGGRITVEGNVGDYVGAPYRGLAEGMSGGTIVIHGSAGSNAGYSISGGLIEVKGNAGEFAAAKMIEGTVLVRGSCRGRAGAGMKGGKLILLGEVHELLPGFNITGIKKSVKVGDETVEGPFFQFEGDLPDSWSGKLFVSTASNPRLKILEERISSDPSDSST